MRRRIERLAQHPHAHSDHQREHEAEDQDQPAVGRARLRRPERLLEHAELLAELPPLELRLDDRLVVALREVLERVEQVLVLDLQRVQLFGHGGRRVDLALDLLAELREPVDLRLRGLAAQLGAARLRLGLLGDRVERRRLVGGGLLDRLLEPSDLVACANHVGVLLGEAAREGFGERELEHLEPARRARVVVRGTHHLRARELAAVEVRVARRLVVVALRGCELGQHPLELPLVRVELFGQRTRVVVLHLRDLALGLVHALREPVELAFDELEALLRLLDPRVDVGLDEVVGEALRDVARDVRIVVLVDDPELVDLELLARVAGGALLELRNDRLDAHVLAHPVDDLLAQQVLRLLLVEAELVDDPRQAGPREDLRRHQVQALIDVALLHPRLHQLLGDRLRLHQHRGVARVDVRERHRDPVDHEHHAEGARPRDLGAAAQDRAEVVDLEAAVDVHEESPRGLQGRVTTTGSARRRVGRQP